jgi:addiction module HigA family antidote
MSEALVRIGMKPPHAGSIFRDEVLAEFGLSITRGAEILGVRRATLSDLVNGKATLSAEMALRIEKAFGVSMDTMLRMQAWYDSFTMRERAGEIDVKRYEPA